MKQTSMILKVKNIGMVLALFLVLCMGAGAVTCYAEASPTTVTLDSASDSDTQEETMYKIKGITGVRTDTTVTITSDNGEIAGICYKKVTKNTSEYCGPENSISFKGNEYAKNLDKIKGKGTYYGDLTIQAKSAGAANITVTVNDSAGNTVSSHVYAVTVRAISPVFKKMPKKSIYPFETKEFKIKNMSEFANIKIYANKEKAVSIGYYDSNADKDKKVLISGTKENATNIAVDKDGYTIYPKKAGNFILTVVLEQDSKVFQYEYNVKVEKYVNPFTSFKVGNKDYAKKFNKNLLVADKGTTGKKSGILKKSDYKYMSSKTFKIKMRKGFKLKKVTYVPQGAWSVAPKKIKNGKMPKDFWEFYIHYKDKSGTSRMAVIWKSY